MPRHQAEIRRRLSIARQRGRLSTARKNFFSKLYDLNRDKFLHGETMEDFLDQPRFMLNVLDSDHSIITIGAQVINKKSNDEFIWSLSNSPTSVFPLSGDVRYLDFSYANLKDRDKFNHVSTLGERMSARQIIDFIAVQMVTPIVYTASGEQFLALKILQENDEQIKFTAEPTDASKEERGLMETAIENRLSHREGVWADKENGKLEEHYLEELNAFIRKHYFSGQKLFDINLPILNPLVKPESEIDYKSLVIDPTDTPTSETYFINADTQDLPFEYFKPVFPDLAIMLDKPIYKVLDLVKGQLGHSFHLPGIEHLRWLIDNPVIAKTMTKGDWQNLIIFPGTLIFTDTLVSLYDIYRWRVPVALFNSSGELEEAMLIPIAEKLNTVEKIVLLRKHNL